MFSIVHAEFEKMGLVIDPINLVNVGDYFRNDSSLFSSNNTNPIPLSKWVLGHNTLKQLLPKVGVFRIKASAFVLLLLLL